MMKERRGRTVDAVVNPNKYESFPGITDRVQFEEAWRTNPMWVFANLAHAAYHDLKENQRLFAELGAEAVKYYTSKPDKNGIVKGRQAFLFIWSDKAFVAFRGTEGSETLGIKTPEHLYSIAQWLGIEVPEEISLFLATDIIDDLKFNKKEHLGAEVHQGFLEATDDLWLDILNDLKELELSDPDQVYVTGHSLGAAMAIVAGMRHQFKQIVTFGAPRVGKNLEKAIQSDTPHIRFVNGDDPVTKIVPTFWPFSFEHHGELRNIVDAEYGGPNLLYDHSIVNYAEVLEGDLLKTLA